MSDAWWHIDLKHLEVLTAISIVLFVVANAAVIVVLIRLPANYFVAERRLYPPKGSSIVRWVLLVLKNLLGLMALIVGVILSVPGVPGPGLLVIFMGVLLLDFPGKFQLERKIIAIPQVAEGLDRIRARFKRAPFERPTANSRAT